jgi:hypothetical protein
MPESPGYQSYLIRLYRQKKNGPVALRILLENVQTGERLGFASLQALHEYLEQLVQLPPAKSDDLTVENEGNNVP